MLKKILKLPLINKLLILFTLLNISVFISSFVIMFSSVNVLYTNGIIKNIGAFIGGDLFLAEPSNVKPFISFIFNILAIVLPFGISVFGILMLIKKGNNSLLFTLCISMVIFAFECYMLYYANSYHNSISSDFFTHFIKVHMNDQNV